MENIILAVNISSSFPDPADGYQAEDVSHAHVEPEHGGAFGEERVEPHAARGGYVHPALAAEYVRELLSGGVYHGGGAPGVHVLAAELPVRNYKGFLN